MQNEEMCFCGKYKDQISLICSAPHPVAWIDWAKEREAKNKNMAELDVLRDNFALSGADDTKWIPGCSISEAVLKYIEKLEKDIALSQAENKSIYLKLHAILEKINNLNN